MNIYTFAATINCAPPPYTVTN